MKTLLSILLVCMISSLASAYEPWELNLVIEYAYSNYNAKAPLNFAFQSDEKGLSFAYWNLPVAKPTIAQLNALADVKLVKAKAWKKDHDAQVDIDNATPFEKALIKYLAKKEGKLEQALKDELKEEAKK